MPTDKEKKGLTAKEQSAVNREYEKNVGKKLPKGQNASLSEEAYKEWKTKGKLNYVYFNPAEPPPPRVNVGPLKTKPLKATISPVPERIRTKDVVLNSDAGKKFTPQSKVKRLSSGGRPVLGQNIATTAKNVINKAKYGRQEKMATAGKKALATEGTIGKSSTARIEALKSVKSDLKAARKETGIKVGKQIKDVKKGIRYEKKVMRGKDVYKR